MLLLNAVYRALHLTAAMGWEILWGLILGFALSAVVDVLVSKAELQRLLPDSSPRSIARASLLGAASSSCSYAAVAIARSIFRKGGDFTASMVFQFASTNLVIELGVLLVALMGWSFAAAEFVGGPLMIAILVVLFRLILRPGMVEGARRQAERGLRGRMEGHAGMATMAKRGSWRQRLSSGEGWTAISHFFAMNWSMLWKDIAVGLLISGTLGALVPGTFWRAAFLSNDPVLSRLWGPVVGPLIAVASFTCSIGNVPLAAVLWNGGISFGGVVAFIFGDLIIVPILNIYRKYYGRGTSLFLLGTFYVAMVLAALAVEGLFGALGWIPAARHANVGQAAFSLNYTTVLNILALVLAGWLYIRYRRTGGPAMMRSMEGGDGHAHEHHHRS
ncbi:MAG: permease [Gemmatimonadetes bacterium]|nr:permease [Gemmatimonadota bacterium]